MKIIKNNNNGHFFTIPKQGIDVLNNKIVYQEFETIVYKEKEGVISVVEECTVDAMISHKLTTVNLQDRLFSDGLTVDFIVNALITELGLSDVTIVDADILQNWLYEGRAARVTILTETVLTNMQPISVVDGVATFSDLHNLIEREKVKNYGFYKDNAKDKCLIIYLNTVEQDDYSIILPYLETEIWIENKLV